MSIFSEKAVVVSLITEGQEGGGGTGGQTSPCDDVGAAHVADDTVEVGIRVDDGELGPDVLFCRRHGAFFFYRVESVVVN